MLLQHFLWASAGGRLLLDQDLTLDAAAPFCAMLHSDRFSDSASSNDFQTVLACYGQEWYGQDYYILQLVQLLGFARIRPPNPNLQRTHTTPNPPANLNATQEKKSKKYFTHKKKKV
jgi:hypothetical protein